MSAPRTTSASFAHASRNCASVVTVVAAAELVDATNAAAPAPAKPSATTKGAAKRARQDPAMFLPPWGLFAGRSVGQVLLSVQDHRRGRRITARLTGTRSRR